eukprot:Hpha_TRINITY_DN16983_c0_g4::TRINITY_DN16983_c0_g4_i1::g.51932::m.51932
MGLLCILLVGLVTASRKARMRGNGQMVGGLFETRTRTASGTNIYKAYVDILDNMKQQPCSGPELKLLSRSVTARWWQPQDRKGSDNVYSAWVRRKCSSRPSHRVIEVGSLDGLQAIEAAEAGCLVEVVEPSPANMKRALRARQKAGIDEDRLRILDVAAASSGGFASFRATLNPKNEVDGAFDGLFQQGNAGLFGSTTIHVKKERLDVLFAAPSQRIDLLKIDVQGAEWDVLEGAEGMLETVKAILVEVSPSLTAAAGGFNITRAINRLQYLVDHGWNLYIVDLVSFHHRKAYFRRHRLPDPPACASQFLQYLLATSKVPEDEMRLGMWADMLLVNKRHAAIYKH